ncbi:kinase-like domain-containing protein [Rhizoctonia solani]|nr:kinase-like domain-containing protein [Rhizoctonia solani]
MVSPWMDNGSLPRYLKDNPKADPCSFCAQISDGLAHLHQIGITHGDIKGANVLVHNDGTCVLADFGNSLFMGGRVDFTATTQENNLTARWAAPELLGETGKRSQAADIYALGMTMLEIMTQKIPYDGASDFAVITFIIQKKLPTRPEDWIPSSSQDGNKFWELLLSCWAHGPKRRPKANEVATTMKSITMKGLKPIH